MASLRLLTVPYMDLKHSLTDGSSPPCLDCAHNMGVWPLLSSWASGILVCARQSTQPPIGKRVPVDVPRQNHHIYVATVLLLREEGALGDPLRERGT
jgi:hypothetical protein